MDVTRASVSAVQLAAAVTTASLQVSAQVVRGSVSVSEAKPRVAVQFTDPVTHVAYTVPAVDLSYILLDVSAELDVRGLSPIVREILPVVDLKAVILGKVLADQYGATDTPAFGVDKPFDNTVFTGEIIDILFVIGRTFTDAFSVADDTTIGLALSKNEVVLTADLYSLLYEKAAADAVGVSDSSSSQLGSSKADSVAVADDNSVGYFKPTDDGATASDVSDVGYSKLVAELLTTLDSAVPVVSFNVQLSDVVTVLENIDADIIIERTFTDLAAFTGYTGSLLNSIALNEVMLNGQSGGDFVRIAMERGVSLPSDTTSTTDAASYFIQDYALQDYFAEDYVGTTGTL